MLDINLLRNDFENISKRILTRNKDYPQLKSFKQIDTKWRKIVNNIQILNAERNDLSKQIATLMGAKNTDGVNKIKAQVKKIKEKIINLSATQTEIEQQLNLVMHSIPNVPHTTVPIGKDEKANVEVRKWGKPNKFAFKYLPHWEIATKNNWVDFERATKLSQSRFTIYRGNGAKLIRALQWFTLDLNTKAGFVEMLPPVIINQETLVGTGHLPKFEEDLFKLTSGHYLSPTAEVQLTGFYRNEILNVEQLPIRLTANTACFRSEAGSAGKDTRGVIRQHQFYKTEMVMITKPNNSYELLEEMASQAENILKALDLPYRTITLCTGDQGFSAAKTYDIEVWLPSYDSYKEISSCSNCEDFQARNLMMRYRDGETGKIVYPHTLNGSGLAIDRLWAAVVENYQQPDGSVKLPKPLQKYFDNQEIIR